MKRSILRIAMLSLLAAAVALAPTQGFAQEKKKEDAPKGEQKKREGLPLGGKISAIDKSAKTLTVGEKTVHITSETRIMKGGKPALLDDAAVGEEVGIYYKKGDGDKLVALTVRIGPRPEGGKKEKKKE